MSAPLSAQRLAEIRARDEAATPGPWEPCPRYGSTFYGNVQGEYLLPVGDINFGVGEQAEADLAFTLAARSDVPVLLAEVDRLRAELADKHDDLVHALGRDGSALDWSDLIDVAATAVRSAEVVTPTRAGAELVAELERRTVGETLLARSRVIRFLENQVVVPSGAHTVWVACHLGSSMPVGYYTGRDAAMGHIHHLLAQEEDTTPAAIELRVIWRADDPTGPEDAEAAWECWLLDADGDDSDTGYVVSPVTVATAYTPPPVDVLPESGAA